MQKRHNFHFIISHSALKLPGSSFALSVIAFLPAESSSTYVRNLLCLTYCTVQKEYEYYIVEISLPLVHCATHLKRRIPFPSF